MKHLCEENIKYPDSQSFPKTFPVASKSGFTTTVKHLTTHLLGYVSQHVYICACVD